MSSSILPAKPPVSAAVRPAWSFDLGVRPRGLVLARERGWALAWDEKNRLHLFNRLGVPQAQSQTTGDLTAVCSAEDGSAYAAAGSRGEVWWLAPDLAVRWQQAFSHRIVGVALDAFGQYLALADARGNLRLLDCHGRTRFHVQCLRPLQYLAFVPAVPLLMGSADYGLVACFDMTGNTIWRDGLVADIGSMAVSGDGNEVLLACFTEGFRRYDRDGKSKDQLQLSEPCRLGSLSFSGSLILAAGLSNRLALIDRKGRRLYDYTLEAPALAAALGPLADYAVAALTSGEVVGLDLQRVLPG